MIVTTIDKIVGYSIDKYIGFVSANQVIRAHGFWKSIASITNNELIDSITNVVERNSGLFNQKLDFLYSKILSSLQTKANGMGANAIVGVRMDVGEMSVNGKSLFILSAQGTAVTVSIDRHALFKKLHELKEYVNDGLLSQEEYERECDRVRNNMEDIIAEETRQIEAVKQNQERAIKEAEKKMLQLQQRILLNNERVSKIDKELKGFGGFHIGEVVEIIETGEYFSIDAFTKDGDVICVKGDDVTAYSINEIQHGNLD